MSQLEKFFEYCGIKDVKLDQIRAAGFEEIHRKQYIVIKIFRKANSYSFQGNYEDEYIFGPSSNLYDFLLDYFHLQIS